MFTNASNRKSLQPNALLIVGLIIGLAFCFFIPYGAGFDEETHVLRIFDLARFNMLPNRGPENKTVGFSEFFSMSYQRRYFQTPAFNLLNKDNFFRQADEDLMIKTETRSVYSPVIFLPQALITRFIWLKLDLPIIPGVILLRFVGLLFYITLVYFAVSLLPTGKWVLTILACSPTALFQAATINADGFTISVSFLLIGLVFYALGKKTEPISLKTILFLAGSVLLLGFAKPGAIVLLLFLFVIPKKRFSSNGWLFFLITCAIVSVIINFGWLVLSVQGSGFDTGGANSFSETIKLILAAPGAFLAVLFEGFFSSLIPLYRAWVGAYGHWVGVVPTIVYWLYPVTLFTAIVTEFNPLKFQKEILIGTWFVFLFTTFGITAFHLFAIYLNGDYSVLGRQGRYYIPFTPLLFIPFSGFIKLDNLKIRLLRLFSIALYLFTMSFYSFGLYATYYTDCAYETFFGESCKMPKYKNLEIVDSPEVLVNKSNSIKQTFTNTCNHLESIQVYIKSVPEITGTLQFSLVDPNGKVLTKQIFDTQSVQSEAFLTLPFNAPVIKNAVYEIRLESSDLIYPAKIKTGIRSIDVYDGELTIAGKPFDGDLIFFYICTNLNQK